MAYGFPAFRPPAPNRRNPPIQKRPGLGEQLAYNMANMASQLLMQKLQIGMRRKAQEQAEIARNARYHAVGGEADQRLEHEIQRRNELAPILREETLQGYRDKREFEESMRPLDIQRGREEALGQQTYENTQQQEAARAMLAGLDRDYTGRSDVSIVGPSSPFNRLQRVETEMPVGAGVSAQSMVKGERGRIEGQLGGMATQKAETLRVSDRLNSITKDSPLFKDKNRAIAWARTNQALPASWITGKKVQPEEPPKDIAGVAKKLGYTQPEIDAYVEKGTVPTKLKGADKFVTGHMVENLLTSVDEEGNVTDIDLNDVTPDMLLTYVAQTGKGVLSAEKKRKIFTYLEETFDKGLLEKIRDYLKNERQLPMGKSH